MDFYQWYCLCVSRGTYCIIIIHRVLFQNQICSDIPKLHWCLLSFQNLCRAFDLTRFNTKSKPFLTLVQELLYADDADFVVHTREERQAVMGLFLRTCATFLLIISLKKTIFIFTSSLCEPYIKLKIFVLGTKLDLVNSFVYFRSTLSRDRSLDSEINFRMESPTSSFGSQKSVCDLTELTPWKQSLVPLKCGFYKLRRLRLYIAVTSKLWKDPIKFI